MPHKQTSKSLYQQISWKKQNKYLQQDADDNIQLKKQINKQSDMDSLIQININDRIYQLKLQAIDLSKKLQNQKYKNIQLQTIIKTIKYRMEGDKKQQSSFINDSNSQNIQALERKIKKLQYDLSQLITRANRVSSNATQGKHQISLLRTQRSIDSNIFRNIEKELIDYQMEFKKLLIQKIKHQKIYSLSFNQYNSLRSKAAQYFIHQQTSRKNSIVYEPISDNSDDNQLISFVKKSVQLNSNHNHGNNHNHNHGHNNNHKFKQLIRTSQFCRQIFHSQLDNKKDQSEKANNQFSVKKLFLKLNMSNLKQFIDYFNNIGNLNEQYFKELNQKSDEITKLEEDISQIQCSIKGNQIRFYQPPPALTKVQKRSFNCQKLKNQIINVKQNSQQLTNKFKSFLKTQPLHAFINSLQINQKQVTSQQQFDLFSFSQLFQKIQEKMNGFKYYSVPNNPTNSEPSILKTGRSQRQRKQQKLDDVMNRIKVHEQSDKIMKRQDFRDQYRKIIQGGSTLNSKQNMIKKKSRKVLF